MCLIKNKNLIYLCLIWPKDMLSIFIRILLMLVLVVLIILYHFVLTRWSGETRLMAGWGPWTSVWSRCKRTDWESFLCHSCHPPVLSTPCAAGTGVGVLQAHILRPHESDRASWGGWGGHRWTRFRRFVPRLRCCSSAVLVSGSPATAPGTQLHTVSKRKKHHNCLVNIIITLVSIFNNTVCGDYWFA